VDHEGLARNVFKKPFINAVEIARNHSTEFFFQDAMSVVDGNLKVYYDHRIKKDRKSPSNSSPDCAPVIGTC